MEPLFRRHFYVVTLLILLGNVYFVGSGMSRIVAAVVRAEEPIADAPPPPRPSLDAPSAVPSTRDRDPSAILSRNFFDSSTGPLNAAGEVGGVPTRCAEGLRLVSTMASTAPAGSLALIRSGSKTRLYREGSILGAQTVSRILGPRIFLRSPGRAECVLEMFGTQDHMPSPPVDPGARGLEVEIARGIEQVGANEFHVRRRLLDYVLENPATLLRSARIISYIEGERLVGFQILGISRESPLGLLGLQNGDVVHSINDYDLSRPGPSPRLWSADRLTVTLSRNGIRQNLNYTIR